MRLKLLLAVLLLATPSLADTPALIAADYRLQAAKAVAHLNQKLEQSAAPFAAKLLQQGDTAGAQQVTQDVRAKLAGNPVYQPHASLTQIFAQYDQARAKAIESAQKASLSRMDALLETPAGRKLDVITALGKVRTEIDDDTPIIATPLPPRWTYHRNASSPSMGDLVFTPDGKWTLIDADAKSHYGTQIGTWVQTGKDTLDLTYKGANWKMTYGSQTGVIDRPDIGKRYLKRIPQP